VWFSVFCVVFSTLHARTLWPYSTPDCDLYKLVRGKCTCTAQLSLSSDVSRTTPFAPSALCGRSEPGCSLRFLKIWLILKCMTHSVRNKICILEKIKSRSNSGNTWYLSAQYILLSHLLSTNVKIKTQKTTILHTSSDKQSSEWERKRIVSRKQYNNFIFLMLRYR
jgi:hypothetical protein